MIYHFGGARFAGRIGVDSIAKAIVSSRRCPHSLAAQDVTLSR